MSKVKDPDTSGLFATGIPAVWQPVLVLLLAAALACTLLFSGVSTTGVIAVAAVAAYGLFLAYRMRRRH